MPYELDHPTDLLIAAIDDIGSGNRTLITGVASKQIKVFQVFLGISAGTTLIIRDGATTNLTGNLNLTSMTLDYTGQPWFTTTAGNSFIVNLAAVSQISGVVYYALE